MQHQRKRQAPASRKLLRGRQYRKDGQTHEKELAQSGMTMVVVTHEMAFARDVSSQVVFMHQGVICEQGTPDQVFGNPQQQETRDFLSRFRGE